MTDPSVSATVSTVSQSEGSPSDSMTPPAAAQLARPQSEPLDQHSNSTSQAADAQAPHSSSSPDSDSLEPPSRVHIRFKSEKDRLLLLLPPENDTVTTHWSELWQQLKQRLQGGDRFWRANTVVHLMAHDRLLDARQLQEIADVLSDAKLHLKRVYTSRRQTAVAAATAGYSVEQHSPVPHLRKSGDTSKSPLADPLYVQMTVRSGVEIRHPGTVIVLGDVNPGGAIIADGDVIIWGVLRGVAQAGAAGDASCLIMSLRMEPTQIRIGDAVARSPETPPVEFYPEVAYATDQGIRITKASDFPRMRLSLQA
ncbi:MAG: septum site-determining protein MinC [Elainellaceae cyanobacterium]